MRRSFERMLYRAAVVALALGALGGHALAGPDAPSDHRHQFGVSADVGSGYRALFPYGSGTSCNTKNGTTGCTGALPFFLDLGVTFGVSRTFDLLLEDRIGLQADYTGTHNESLAFGFRYYPDPTGVAKMMAGVEAVADFTNFNAGVDATSHLSGTDLALHPFGGLQLDFTHDVGAYVAGGVTAGFVRWLRFELDVFGGVQARFP